MATTGQKVLKKHLKSILYKLNAQNLEMEDMEVVIEPETLASIKELFDNLPTLEKIQLYVEIEKKTLDKSLIHFKSKNRLELLRLRVWLVKAVYISASVIILAIVLISDLAINESISTILEVLKKIIG